MTIQEFTPSPIPHGNITWTDERITELKHRRFKLKESCGYIAKEMGLTRSAVIGKIGRLGLSVPRPEKGTKPVPLVSLRPITSGGRERKTRIGRHRSETEAASTGTEATEITVEFVSPNPVTLMQLGDHHCRFPLGQSPSIMFCGVMARDDGPYCTAHARICYQPKRPLAPREPLIAGRGRG